MDQDLQKFLDRKFHAVDEKFEETKRYFDVVAEGMEYKIQLVAEGVANLNEKMDRHIEENEAAHREILSAIKFSYAELDQRIRVLESNVQGLSTRMERLEARR